MRTPIRRLEGISWWVIDDPEAIYDFVNTEVLKEWETDARTEHRDPKDDPWLKTLQSRKWYLETTELTRIRLNPEIMNYVNPKIGYVFSKRLATRSAELRQNLELGSVVFSPLVVREEDTRLVDGYCRYATLKALNVSKIYVYSGILRKVDHCRNEKRPKR